MHSAEWYRGAVAALGRMVDECQTVFDSDLPHITEGNLEDYLAEYSQQLAEAEAREAGEPTLAEQLAEAQAEAKERTTMAARAQEAMRYLLNGLPATDAIWAAYGNADSARAWLAARDARMKALGAAEALEKEAGEIGRALIKGMADAGDYKPDGLVVRTAENCCEYLRSKAAQLRQQAEAARLAEGE